MDRARSIRFQLIRREARRGAPAEQPLMKIAAFSPISP